MSNQEIYEGIEQLAASHEEADLIARYITSEKLKDWITLTKEGQAINSRIMSLYDKAHQAFEECHPTDIEGLQKARIDIQVSKSIYEIFSSIFEEGRNAEHRLNEPK